MGDDSICQPGRRREAIWQRVDRARTTILQQASVPADHVLIAAIHSHTGPCYWGVLRDHFQHRAVKTEGTDPREAVSDPALLAKRIAQSVARAQAAARRVNFAVGSAIRSTKEPRLGFHSLFHRKDDTAVFNPGKLNKNIVRVAGPISPDVSLLTARDAASAARCPIRPARS